MPGTPRRSLEDLRNLENTFYILLYKVFPTCVPPTISFVTFYRHYPDTPTSLERIKFFANNVREQSERYGLDSEVVIVESQPGVLSNVFESPKIKVVQFPTAQFLWNLAFNIGIRHATGEYILAGTRDSTYNSELMQFLASGKLRPHTIYRIDRRDVKQLERYPDSVSELLRYCKENTYRVNGKWDAYLPDKKWARPAVALLMGALFFPYSVPHTNAAGDFTLMHRDDWYRIRGYPQVISSGLHLDSFVIYSAIFLGLKQVILKDPMRLYHVEHPRTDPVPSTNILDCLKIMRFAKKPIILNDEDWGEGLG
ncbi:MAG: hypothetical protein OK456_03430 [Thaumarchaeota archaeon]|nr:hypothetical protein [Nitrososphaerota archaeon]